MAVGLACLAAPLPAADSSVDPRVAIATRPARPKPGLAADIRVHTNLVLIPVTVTDPFGAPFSGLPRDAFHLFEDGVEQQLRYFASEDAPVSLGIVFDASGSMQGKLDQSREAVARFFRAAMAGDEFFLVEFNDAPRLLHRFTSDTAEIEKALARIQARSWTALLDAVYMAIHETRRARNARKALLILSDGGDNNSRYTEAEMKALVREGDVCLYAIGVGGGLLKHHVRLLKQLAQETGGLYCQADKLTDLADAVENIGAAIRHQYLLGYSPVPPASGVGIGMYRRIQVKLTPAPDLPPLHASWRAGYYAPE